MKNRRLAFILAVLFLKSISFAQPEKIDSLKTLLENHPQRDTIRVNLLNQISNILVNNDSERFFKTINEATELSYEIDYLQGRADSYMMLAKHYFRNASYDSMLVYTGKSFALFDSIGNKRGIALSYRAFSIYYAMIDNYNKAIDYSFKAIDVFEEIGNKKDLSISLANTASVYTFINENKKALEFYNRALEIEKELGNKFVTATILVNMANIYTDLHELDKTTEVLKQALRVAQEIDHKPFIAHILVSLAENSFLQKDYVNSQAYYDQSLEICNKYGFVDVKSDCLIGLTKIYFEKKEYTHALQYGQDGLKLIEELNNIERLNRMYEIMADLYSAIGNYKQAFEYHKKFKITNDSLFNERNIKELANIENQYRFEKEKEAIAAEQAKKDTIQMAEMKQQKFLRNIFIVGSLLFSTLALITLIILLQKRKANKILAQQKAEIEKQSQELIIVNKKLTESNATKDKFFSIIAHDLKSSFNAIIGFLELLSSGYSEYDSQDREHMLKLAADSATNTFRLLENLLIWSMSQTGRLQFEPTDIQTTQIISETFNLVENSAKNKKIKLIDQSDKDLTIHADKEQIMTILRNLISNSIKFTPEGGSVSTNTIQNNTETIFSIEDTGIGMEQVRVKKLFNISEKTNTPGTNNEKGTGLGLILCKEFIEMHKGQLWIESELGKGSKFSFSIPK